MVLERATEPTFTPVGFPVILRCSSQKQEVLIVLDDPNPAPSEKVSKEGNDSTTTPLILPSQELLDTPPEDTGSKPVLEDPQVLLPIRFVFTSF